LRTKKTTAPVPNPNGSAKGADNSPLSLSGPRSTLRGFYLAPCWLFLFRESALNCCLKAVSICRMLSMRLATHSPIVGDGGPGWGGWGIEVPRHPSGFQKRKPLRVDLRGKAGRGSRKVLPSFPNRQCRPLPSVPGIQICNETGDYSGQRYSSVPVSERMRKALAPGGHSADSVTAFIVSRTMWTEEAVCENP
jgi:hypothetical protein